MKWGREMISYEDFYSRCTKEGYSDYTINLLWHSRADLHSASTKHGACFPRKDCSECFWEGACSINSDNTFCPDYVSKPLCMQGEAECSGRCCDHCDPKLAEEWEDNFEKTSPLLEVEACM